MSESSAATNKLASASGALRERDAVLNVLKEGGIELNKVWETVSEPQTDLIAAAITTLAETILKDPSVKLVKGDAIRTIKAIIAQLDQTISAGLNEVLHDPSFQKLEGTWRGLHHLVKNTTSSATLKLRVLNVSKKEATKCLQKYEGSEWTQSPLYRKIYGAEFDMPSGTPYGMLVGDYEIENTPDDLDLLKGMSKIAAASLAPFVSAASPHMLNMKQWKDLGSKGRLDTVVDSSVHAAWNSFRETEDSAYVALTMPRFLGRLPYGKGGRPVEDFDFQESVDGKDSSRYLWCNSAYAYATNVTRAYFEYGWCAKIAGEEGGSCREMVVHNFHTDEGDVDMKCPTEHAIGDQTAGELAKLGLLAFQHQKGKDWATFYGAETVYKPSKFRDPSATANAKLMSQLPYQFSVSRFAHFLKVIGRRYLGTFKDAKQVQAELEKWLKFYTTDSGNSEFYKAQKPLQAAEVRVVEKKDSPGSYSLEIYLKPHYMITDLHASLRMVTDLPSARGGG